MNEWNLFKEGKKQQRERSSIKIQRSDWELWKLWKTQKKTKIQNKNTQVNLLDKNINDFY